MRHANRSLHQIAVDEFMRRAGQAVPDEPCMPDRETRLLRAKLILEECLETVHALGFVPVMTWGVPVTTSMLIGDAEEVEPNLIEIADGCADISVVTTGTLSACGIADEELLAEVDASNLRKFGPGCWKREDGKHMKPADWVKPDIAGVLEAQKDPVFKATTNDQQLEHAAKLLTEKLDGQPCLLAVGTAANGLVIYLREPTNDEIIKDIATVGWRGYPVIVHLVGGVEPVESSA